MGSRAVIEQVKGVPIVQWLVPANVAFDLLSQASQLTNRQLRDIAQAVVDGEQPGS